MPSFQISIKNTLRWNMKNTIKNLPLEYRKVQSKKITYKVLTSDAFKRAERISIYLSTEYEVDTTDILQEIFKQNKQVFVPTYQGNIMEMVNLNSMDDFNSLPVTKWNIKQPLLKENRENALTSGGLDLFLIPGVAFTDKGGRLGHGKGYYDKYLSRYFKLYPRKHSSREQSIKEKIEQNKTILFGLAFKEQIIDESILPIDSHDFLLDTVISSV